MSQKRVLLIAAVLLVVVGAAVVALRDDSSGVAHSEAAEAQARQLELESKGQWGRLWDELHPAQQAVVDRDLFASCAQRSTDSPLVFDDIDFIESFEEPITVAPMDEPVESVALTYRLALGSESVTRTTHQVLVDGTWRWSLISVEDYADGECPI